MMQNKILVPVVRVLGCAVQVTESDRLEAEITMNLAGLGYEF